MNFNEKLQRLRKEKKFSQEELAEMLDVTRQSVSKWESGQTYPEMDKLLAICKIFNCTLEELTNDEIKEVSSEKKSGFKSILDSILELVSKSYHMFTHMHFGELVRCIFMMVIVGIILGLVNIPLNAFQYSIYDILYSFGSTMIAEVLSKIINFLLDAAYCVGYVLLFIYIFKIGFLDKYEFVMIESKKNSEEPKDEIVEEKEKIREEKIIKEYRTPNFAFFETLGKISMFFIKIFLIFFSIPFIFTLFGLFSVLVLDVYLIFEGIKYFSFPILIIFSIILNILFIIFVCNFIFNKKQKFRLLLIIFIISVAGLGAGSGLLLLDIHNTEIVSGLPSEIRKINNTYEYTYEDGLFFDYWNDIEYAVDNNLKDRIHVSMDSYEGINRIRIEQYEDGYHFYDNQVDIENMMNFIDTIIVNLKERKIYDFNYYEKTKLTVTASERVINNLRKNLSEYNKNQHHIQERYSSYENQIEDLYDQISDLEEQISELELGNDQLTYEKEELQRQIEEYKDRIKSLIE